MESFNNYEIMLKVSELAREGKTPEYILKQRQKIEGSTKRLEKEYQNLTQIELEQKIQEIVKMKLELDNLYLRWLREVEEELS